MLGLVVAGMLAGCFPQESPVPTESAAPSTTPSPGETEDPGLPGGAILRPGESAAANKLFFEKIIGEFYAANGKSTGQALVDHLVGGGFDKADMEVTYDATEIGLASDSLLVSVRIEGECLIAQLRPDTVTTALTSVLGTGRCMVGATRPIDW